MGGTFCDFGAVDHVFRSGGGWHMCGFTREHLVFFNFFLNLKTPRVSTRNLKTSPVRPFRGAFLGLGAMRYVFRSGGGWHVCCFTTALSEEAGSKSSGEAPPKRRAAGEEKF